MRTLICVGGEVRSGVAALNDDLRFVVGEEPSEYRTHTHEHPKFRRHCVTGVGAAFSPEIRGQQPVNLPNAYLLERVLCTWRGLSHAPSTPRHAHR
ncbi:uncharacterized protein OE_6120F (plasmid) [Halobacterium salinarum R1]|uniref:Uncharacterized protein n=2 Tax=Halobacterium salinarum NRC-34001 TaxID=2886895 RepID=A0A510NBD3_HALSA|nr:uncharacterized protein OE_6120F [Halobacterium salinarum R1]DAC80005.1 TPA_inf: uncharacterized protein VNG_6432a [Halobacterium salinarum NRC-1]